MEHLQSNSCVNNIVWLHHLDSVKMFEEQAKWKLHKDVVRSFEEILEAASNKTKFTTLSTKLIKFSVIFKAFHSTAQ